MQGRTLQRLGVVLVESYGVEAAVISEFARLQMTETVYRLFLWETGTYEFEQRDVDPPLEGIDPIASEHILMEGVRMMDEWPEIRRRLPSYGVTFERAKPLPVANHPDIGPSERRAYELVEPGADLQSIIHQSRLGEFETSRAMLTLISSGFVRAVHERNVAAQAKAPKRRNYFGWLTKLRPTVILGRTIIYLVIGAAIVMVVRNFDVSWYGLSWSGVVRYRSTVAHKYVSEAQLRAIRRGLEVYRLAHGAYPDDLEALVKDQILNPRDLQFPFEQRYYYRRDGDQIRLLRPIY